MGASECEDRRHHQLSSSSHDREAIPDGQYFQMYSLCTNAITNWRGNSVPIPKQMCDFKNQLKWLKMLKTFIIIEILMHVLAGNNLKEAKHFHDKSVQIDSRKYLENIYNYYLKGKLCKGNGGCLGKVSRCDVLCLCITILKSTISRSVISYWWFADDQTKQQTITKSIRHGSTFLRWSSR